MRVPLAVKVGHAADPDLKSGVTVIIPDQPAVAAVHTAGGAPGTRETDLLAPQNLVERVDAIVLSGGSVFGLAAADGVVAWLAGQNRGFVARGTAIPIVPAAIILDFDNGGRKLAQREPQSGGEPAGPADNPYRALGIDAAQSADREFGVGTVGAGTGATSLNFKGGFGAAVSALPGGGHVAAFAVANPGGRITYGDGPHFRAAACEQNGEFGDLGFPPAVTPEMTEPRIRADAGQLASTTLGVIATNIPLDKARLKRVAMAAHDGLAMAIYPVHTPFDGDTVFALSTSGTQGGQMEKASLHELKDLGAVAAAAMARAITLAIYHATPAPGDVLPTWRERFGNLRGG